MIDVVTLLQTALDSALYELPLHSYWKRKPEIDDDPNPDEYVVYTVDEHEPDDGADGEILIYRSYAVVRYFCRDSWQTDTEKITLMRTHMEAIRNALKAGGFDVTTGWQDVGDVDGINFETFVIHAEMAEVDRGND